MKRNWKDFLYIYTILFFILGYFNMIFAWIGLLCFILPFMLLLKDGKKTWCQAYCPRAKFFTAVYSRRKKHNNIPSFLLTEKAKGLVLGYFLLNLFFVTMSTIMVFKGRVAAMDRIRLLIAFRLPWKIPELLTITGIPAWMVHGFFRIYSMMLTTTLIGIILGYFYKPRTWCVVCPMNTLMDSVKGNNRDS